MSSQKTENLNLHAWQPIDRFLRAELNENFSLLDAAVASRATVVAGVYTGDNTDEQTIDLGFPPVAVLVVNQQGQMGWTSGSVLVKGGLALQGFNLYSNLLELTDSGFIVRNINGNSFLRLNTGDTHFYLAFH